MDLRDLLSSRAVFERKRASRYFSRARPRAVDLAGLFSLLSRAPIASFSPRFFTSVLLFANRISPRVIYFRTATASRRSRGTARCDRRKANCHVFRKSFRSSIDIWMLNSGRLFRGTKENTC
ncbi:hypothetical protein PUN28_004132 [Cardiocondyla obscurior]|uniref:Uncharacterized protein n=1 Tax=Cardiocondyla obscurior TaxID=286306 RepID=A0AAW2GPQ7_9HYME